MSSDLTELGQEAIAAVSRGVADGAPLVKCQLERSALPGNTRLETMDDQMGGISNGAMNRRGVCSTNSFTAAFEPKRAFGNIDCNFKNDVASAPRSEDETMLLRRKFLYLFAGVTTPLSSIAQAQVSPRTSQSVRAATGLLATWQSTAWLGAEAGLFKKRGIDMTLPAIAVGGPEAAAGLIRGDWEFAHTGTVPVAEEVLKGRDVVILATPTSDFPKSFVMTRKEITQLAQLDGKKVGVLTESGQTSVATRITVEKAGATATYLPLIKFDRIYAALAAGEIDAGALPIDLRFSGQVRYGWNAFPIDAFDTPSIFATTRKLIVSNRELVMNVMQGFVETIHLFKTRPDIVVPLLQRYIKIEDRKVAEDLYAFHLPVFQKVPRPSFPGLQALREFLVAKYPTAMSLKESDIAESSFIDELERSGFIDRLYAADTK